MNSREDVHSVARVAATLRTILAGFRQGGQRSLPLLFAEQDGGDPEAVILPYDLFTALCEQLERTEDESVGDLAASRVAIAPAPGEGLTNETLAHLIAEAHPENADEILQAGGATTRED
ncbi:hypothetical protein [Streptomyces tauricus]